MKQLIDLLITDAAELLTMEKGLGLIEGGALAIHQKRIVGVGKTEALKKKFQAKKTISAKGKVVTPGLIDCHTHLLFAGSREEEYKMRLEGKSYLDILKAGGGILSTVKALRGASKQELIAHVKKWLREFLKYGVTTVEIKSGYGLNYETEKKMLEVLCDLKKKSQQELVVTFLGAHAFPIEHRDHPERYIEEITQKMLPAFKNCAEFCDIFIEKGAFSYKQGKIILRRARSLGYKIKMHTNQMSSLGGPRLAKKFNAVSVDHLDTISENEIRTLAQTKAVAVLAPGATFFLKEKCRPPLRALLDHGIPVAITTDFNPGSSPSPNLHFMMNLAVQLFDMKPEEVWPAVTLNAAKALNREKEFGSLAVGKKAHIVIWDMPNYLYPFYHFGENFVEKVIFG